MAKKKTQVRSDSGFKTRKEKNKHNEKILRNILIVAGIIIIAGFLGAFLTRSESVFEYKGVNYTIVEFCDAKPCLKTYNTKLPVIHNGEMAEYNFFFRNDPRKLDDKVPFEGELSLETNMILDIDYGRTCDGYESVALDNFGTVFRIGGVDITADENMICGSESGYMYVLIEEGDETRIEKTGDSCYNIKIKECEILQGTERFMNEALVEINKKL